MNTIVSISKLRKTFNGRNETSPVLDDVSFTVSSGEILGIFGPNGAGKTTLLNIIAGIESADEDGMVYLGVDRESISAVFQDYRRSLLPWASILENISFPMRIKGSDRGDRAKLASMILDEFGIDIDLSTRIGSLSGGQAQLVCILRALIRKPRLLILDEPFSALDYETTIKLRDRLLAFVNRHDISVILVSHDLDEALFLSDRTLLLSKRPGTVVSIVSTGIGRPRSIMDLTNPRFVQAKADALSTFEEITLSP